MFKIENLNREKISDFASQILDICNNNVFKTATITLIAGFYLRKVNETYNQLKMSVGLPLIIFTASYIKSNEIFLAVVALEMFALHKIFRVVKAILNSDPFGLKELKKECIPDKRELLKLANTTFDEMRRGSEGKPSSLGMFLSKAHSPSGNESGKAIVLDIGGSTLRTGLASFKGRKASLEHVTKISVNNKMKNGSCADFCDMIAKKVAGIFKASGIEKANIGACLSFPLDDDGKLVKWTKGYNFTDLKPGGNFMEKIKNAFYKEGISEKVETIFRENDTVGAGLSALYTNNSGKTIKLAGILGTGTNGCGIKNGRLYNSEWGDLSKGFELTKYEQEQYFHDKNIDYQLERALGGGFVAESFTICIKSKLKNLKFEKPITAEIISKIIEDNDFSDLKCGRSLSRREKIFIREVAKIKFTRAAYFASALTLGAFKFYDGDAKSGIAAFDGSLYSGSRFFREKLDEGVERMLGKDHKVEFIGTKDGSGLGVGIGALMMKAL